MHVSKDGREAPLKPRRVGTSKDLKVISSLAQDALFSGSGKMRWLQKERALCLAA